MKMRLYALVQPCVMHSVFISWFSILHRDPKPGNVNITPVCLIFRRTLDWQRWCRGRKPPQPGLAMTPGHLPSVIYGQRAPFGTDVYCLAQLYTPCYAVSSLRTVGARHGQCPVDTASKTQPQISKRLAMAVWKKPWLLDLRNAIRTPGVPKSPARLLIQFLMYTPAILT